MKQYILFLFLVLAVSCKPFKDEYYVRMTSQCDIIHVQLPDTISVSDTARISAVAQANSSCWSNLGFELIKSDDFDYYLQAYGIYESYGSCQDAVVTGDTTIKWKPGQAGLYKLHIFKTPVETITDTIIVR